MFFSPRTHLATVDMGITPPIVTDITLTDCWMNDVGRAERQCIQRFGGLDAEDTEAWHFFRLRFFFFSTLMGGRS